jgi:hypothetical protein
VCVCACARVCVHISHHPFQNHHTRPRPHLRTRKCVLSASGSGLGMPRECPVNYEDCNGHDDFDGNLRDGSKVQKHYHWDGSSCSMVVVVVGGWVGVDSRSKGQ